MSDAEMLAKIQEILFVRENMVKTLNDHPGDRFAIDMFVAADLKFWATLREIFGGELQAEKQPRRIS